MFSEAINFLQQVNWASVAVFAVALAMTGLTAHAAYLGRSTFVDFYRHFSWKLMLKVLPLTFLVVFIVVGLLLINPTIFGFGIFSILGFVFGDGVSEAVRSGAGTNVLTSGQTSSSYTNIGVNISIAAVYIKYLGVIFAGILLMALPFLALVEEEIFRENTWDWPDGIKRSLAFGFFHMLFGVPLAAAIGLSVVGLYLTHFYFVGGTRYSAQAHFQYNLVFVLLLFLMTLFITFA